MSGKEKSEQTGPNQSHPIAVETPGKEIQESTGATPDELTIETVEVGINLTTQEDESKREAQVSDDIEGALEQGSFEAVRRNRA